jgi:adenine-specific DNA-methyltransferase
MKNRLEVAKELLREDGVIFISIDDNEQAYLKVLCDQIFRNNFVATIATITNPAGRDYGGIAKTNDYLLLYTKNEGAELNWIDIEKDFPYQDEKGEFELRELRNRNIRFNINNRPNLFYPFYLNPDSEDKNGFYEISLEKKKGWIEVLPKKSQNIQTVWRWGKDTARQFLNTELVGKKSNDGEFRIMEKYREKKRMARSVWSEKEIRNEMGTLHIKRLFGGKVFDYPKSEFLLKKIIEIGSNHNDLVLDFFSGSGSFGEVAHKMGRQYILIEQMENQFEIIRQRLKKVIDGEQVDGGISKSVGWQGGGDFVYLELMK